MVCRQPDESHHVFTAPLQHPDVDTPLHGLQVVCVGMVGQLSPSTPNRVPHSCWPSSTTYPQSLHDSRHRTPPSQVYRPAPDLQQPLDGMDPQLGPISISHPEQYARASGVAAKETTDTTASDTSRRVTTNLPGGTEHIV